MGFAGTVDYVGRDKKTGLVTLRDWKTSKQRKLPGQNDDKLCNYRLQVAAYSYAFERTYGVKVDRAEVVICYSDIKHLTVVKLD